LTSLPAELGGGIVFLPRFEKRRCIFGIVKIIALFSGTDSGVANGRRMDFFRPIAAPLSILGFRRE
jgi:hypothetical protein